MGSETDDKPPSSARWSPRDTGPASGGVGAPSLRDDARVRSAWRSWLSALATDAEAAMAAALAYESLPPEARDAWLDVLDGDAATLAVPPMALYAPLLAVESDGDRRARMEAAIAADPEADVVPACTVRALHGVACDGTHACVIVAPLYLDFVQVLSCRYTPTGGFVAVKHDPLRNASDLEPVEDVDGVAVEPTPLRVVVEELAHAILADKRGHRHTPSALASFAHLFAPDLEDAGDAEPSRP
jgi:hypothetical protein